jgi:ribosomal protein L37AE/L43A
MKNKKTIIREKFFCPLCGSDRLRRLINGKYKCLLCKAFFSKSKLKKAKIKLRKKPRYIS